ncbi:hypothetical protein ID866_7348 [Astraeus odoratus]|nr:hypothetical protein ID866_7348 [Astraeus odoratus]
MRFDGADHRFHGQLTDQVLYAGRGGSAAPNGTNGTDLAARRRAGPPPAIAVPVAGEDESPGSEATWGTVPTGSLTGSSLSDLGVLLGLHNGGVRGQEGVVDSSRVAREGVDGNIRSEAEEGNEADGRSGTSSLPGAFTPAPIGTSALGLITEDGGDYLRNGPSVAVRPQRRSTSYTATTTQAAQAEHDHQLHHARRGERTRERRRHVSQPADTTEALPNRGAGNITNALSLHFDASPSTHDNYRIPVSSAYVGAGRGPEIIAPTPVFGGPNIIHLWANRA